MDNYSLAISNQNIYFLNRLTKVKSYDHLVSYLASGADVRYYFNVSTCIPEARTTNEEHIQIPVFGGAVKLFIASKSSDDGHIIFSQPRYIDRKANGKISWFMQIISTNERG